MPPLTQGFPPHGQEPTQVSPLALMEQLHASLEGDRRLSHTPNAPEWQHMLTLVEVAKAIYQRLQE
ncbi:MAG: hypothetical protein HC925_04275 [Coleofasciculaceae cyanobacterium SM2_3_26]|nr:hypothetical protein [Coleofasciculaceae cyanobacterium SM2_3_26]